MGDVSNLPDLLMVGEIIQREGPEWANAGPLPLYVTHCVDEAIKENRKLNGDVNGI